MKAFRNCSLWLIIAAVAGVTISSASAADPAVGPDAKEVKAVLDKAAAFLKKQQSEDGSFSAKAGGPGITALIAAGMLQNGYSPDDPVVAKALAYLEKRVQKDGGIYDKAMANYTTSVALVTFKEANTKGRYDTVIKNATQFLKTLQFDESTVEEKDVKFGGVGYDGKSRPDLSNTQFFVDSLLAAGVPKDDPAIKRALKFISRCQNISGESNDQPFAKKATEDDIGGFIYTPALNDKAAAEAAEKGLRSAGVMTYAGLKSFLHAGVDKNDPRVKAAIAWIGKHYTLEENPGQGQRGMYFYYHTFGKAMAALGQDRFEDASGKKHDWRKELFEALKKRQKDDGSWTNDKSDAFLENNPDLATAYALLAISYCKPAGK